MFSIIAENLRWIQGGLDEPDDLCLHGDMTVKISEEIFCFDGTVSSTVISLLRTLTENHTTNNCDIQMLSCCGHAMFANDDLTSVIYVGCHHGIDWNVFHEDGKIKIITKSLKETFITLADYKKEVYEFADRIEAFYKQCSPKKFYNKAAKDGYIAFWNEWHRRRNQS